IPEDFERWGPLWSFERVLPCYRRLERDLDFGDAPYHGAEGPIPVRRFRPDEWLPPQTAFVEACRAAGFADAPDLNAPAAEGVGPIPLNTIDGVRWSTSLGYVDPARHRLNLTIRSRCTVRRRLFERTPAVGVG